MCDKKNSVLFTETECLVLSPDFKLLDESQVLLKVPRQNNMYSFDLKNVIPSGGLTCLFAKATIDESNLWHRRLGHINFKIMNKLMRRNLVRGLPSKPFKNDHTCVACQKGKQHKASCKTKLVSSISQPLQMLHMDLFRPTSVRNINHKTYCLVVTDDYSKFSWVFFLATKDETSGILKTFITSIENQINHKVTIIRCDHGTEFKNNDMNQLCGMKRIKREFSVARTPQQNRAEAVNTACYVQNRVLVTKPHNKTPYELLLDPLSKFDEKADEGFFVGYSINSKAFRVFNTRTRKVEENLHINFLENKPNVVGSRPEWLFEIDLLTNSMNYEPVTAGNQTNKNTGIKDNVDVVPTQQYILLPLLYDSPQSSKDVVANDAGKKTNEEPAHKGERNDNLLVQQKEGYANSTNRDSTISPSVSTVGQNFTNIDDLPTDPLIPDLEDTGIFSGTYDDEDVGVEADINNLETTMNVSPIPTNRIHKDHPKDQTIGDINLATQIRRMIKITEEHAMIEAMQDELLQFKRYTQEEGIDYDEVFAPVARIEAIRLFLAYASFMGFIMYHMDVKSAFLYGTIKEEVYVCQPPGFEDLQFPDKVYKVEKALYGLHQAPRAWYETLSTYLLENGYRRGTIDKTLFNKKDRGDILLVQVYVDDIIFGFTKKSLCVEFKQMMHKRFQMSSMRELTFFLGLQVMQKDYGIFISQDKYVADILKKFDFVTVKTASTPIETNKALLKDEEAKDVDVHLYRSMIRSLMYLIASRPDIMFAVCACARFQVTSKVSHINVVKRIFRYLKGQPKLGLWYPRDSPFDLEAFSDSDYAGDSLDRKSTTGGYQFLGKRFISWQCKKHTIVANSTTEAEYVVAANCCGDSYEKKLIQVIKIHTDHNVVDLLTKAFDVSSDEFGVKTGSCKVNAVRQDLVLLGEMDFLSTSSIHYALTVSPTIYASYIEQFWATAKSKTVNDVNQIHATVDGKTVVISESSVRSDLHFNDENGITCLSNDEIYVNLALMGNWDSTSNKFLMYPRFLQLFLNNRIALAEPFNDIYVTPVHTKRVFINMKRQNKDFSGRITPLFASILVSQVVEGEGSGQPFEPQPPSSTAPPSQVTTVATQHQKTHKPRRAKKGWDTEIPHSSSPPKKVSDEAVYTREDGRVVRAATATSSFEAEQESGSEPRRQDTTLGGANAYTRFETASKKSHDPPLSEGNTSRSGEDSMEHQVDLMDFVPPTPHDSPLLGGHTPESDEDCLRLGDPKDEKESQKIRKGTKGKNSRDEALQDCDFDVLDDAIENVEGGSTAEKITTAGDTLNTASINVSVAGPSHVSNVGPSNVSDAGLSTSIAGIFLKMR
ncbi:putative ribonuclease H-like domain-containing protein [Tanacetum coccineum]